MSSFIWKHFTLVTNNLANAITVQYSIIQKKTTASLRYPIKNKHPEKVQAEERSDQLDTENDDNSNPDQSGTNPGLLTGSPTSPTTSSTISKLHSKKSKVRSNHNGSHNHSRLEIPKFTGCKVHECYLSYNQHCISTVPDYHHSNLSHYQYITSKQVNIANVDLTSGYAIIT